MKALHNFWKELHDSHILFIVKIKKYSFIVDWQMPGIEHLDVAK